MIQRDPSFGKPSQHQTNYIEGERSSSSQLSLRLQDDQVHEQIFQRGSASENCVASVLSELQDSSLGKNWILLN